MKTWMIVPAFAAVFALAAPAVALDSTAYLAGTVPAAETAEESEVCATSAVVVMLLTSDNADYKEFNETAKTVAVNWIPKAAQFRGIESSVYLDSAVSENVTAVASGEVETHTTHFLECMKRTPGIEE